MNHIFYATNNEAKFSDASAYLGAINPELNIEQLPIEIPEVQSDDHDAILDSKIQFVRGFTNRPFIVDDASFYTKRYPNFPGAYAKYANRSLGIEGWSRLFDEGDKIRAVARIALCNFDDVHLFTGEIAGTLHFNKDQNIEKFSLNDHIRTEYGQVLGEALKDSQFLNHRRIALAELSKFLLTNDAEAMRNKDEIGKRWGGRAARWQEVIQSDDSYVNYESNYERVNKLIEHYAPLASGKALEIGCGTGEAGRLLKIANPQLDLLSTDISSGMLYEAKRQTASANLDIDYRQLDITSKDMPNDKFGIIISRGVVVSHLPKSNIYDFLESAANHISNDGYFIFDFIQDTTVGELEKPIDPKNSFKLEQLDELMSHFNMSRIDDSGNDGMRVRVACYRKFSNQRDEV